MTRAVARRRALDALGRILARTLRAAAAALERDDPPAANDAEVLEPTLARLRQRYPDAPEHWLRFVAERMPAGEASAMDARRAAEPGRRGPAAPQAGALPADAHGGTSPRRPAVESSRRDHGAVRRERPQPRADRPVPPLDADRAQPEPRLAMRASESAAPAAAAAPSARAPRVGRPAIRLAAPAVDPARPGAAQLWSPRPRFYRPAPPPHAPEAGTMPRGPSDALRGDRFADWGGRPGAARFGSSAEAAQASSAIPQALSAAADSPATPETSAAAPRAVGARKSRLGSRVAAAIEPRERDAASRLHAAGPTRAAQLFPRAARHPAATSAPADRQDGAATSNPGARFERVRAQLAGTAAAVSAPVFAAEEPRWPELPEWLEPGEADLDAAGRFPREEPERWNALPF